MTTLIVFSHPNHELAIFGFLQRFKPHLLYLTDGGAEDRVAQTRQGLESIGLFDQASFLNHTERSFYDALLACDTKFYEDIAAEVCASCETLRPDQIFCDAVEFYNPVHDMSLPVVRTATRGLIGTPVFEVPLIHQRQAEVEKYEVQRMPASRCSRPIELRLSEEELAAKIRARDHIYTILAGQLGQVILGLPRTRVALEVFAPAHRSLPEPAPDNILRYERRAELLAERGEIDEKITYQKHYLPVASSLLHPQTVLA